MQEGVRSWDSRLIEWSRGYLMRMVVRGLVMSFHLRSCMVIHMQLRSGGFQEVQELDHEAIGSVHPSRAVLAVRVGDNLVIP